jgi:hypothetical protein
MAYQKHVLRDKITNTLFYPVEKTILFTQMFMLINHFMYVVTASIEPVAAII